MLEDTKIDNKKNYPLLQFLNLVELSGIHSEMANLYI